MKDVHVTAELLDSLHDRQMPPEVLVRLVWDHLQALCPVCSDAITTWLRRGRSQDYGGAFDRVIQRAAADEGQPGSREGSPSVRRSGVAERKVARELAEIRRLPAEEALRRVRGASKRFRSPRLVEGLVDEARQHLHGDPRRAVELLSCARAIVERPEEPAPAECRVAVALQYGNALRASRRPDDAQRILSAAREMMRTEPVADSILYATLDSFEGSLRRDQGRFEESRTMLARAILVYRVFGHETQAAKLLLTLSYVHYRLGRNAESLAAIHEALELIDPATELRLACIARQNLASFLCDTGDAAGARRVLAESRRWFERFGAHGAATVFSLGVRWLEGRIAARLGDTSQAEAALEAAAQGFAELGIAYDTALVLLDLADTYLSAGRSEAVQELLPRIEPLLSSSDLHQESVAALLLLQNAIAQQLLSTSTVALVRAKIKKFERR